jgi:hypothetical protein
MSDQERDLCSPSQLNLRFCCPGSANLQKTLPKGSGAKSAPAERGTKLHEVFASVLSGDNISDFNLLPEDESAVEWCLGKVRENILFRFEEPPIMQLEYQIDLSELGIFGGKEGCRIDLFFVIPGIGSIFIDEKYGVSYTPPPKYNWQFKAYAWGLWKAFGGNVEAIKMQPAADEGKEYQTHLFEDWEFGKIGGDIKAIVEKTRVLDAPLVRGPHCTRLFCKCQDVCPLWRQAVLEIPQGITVKTHLEAISPADRRDLYENLTVASKWVENAIGLITALALSEGMAIEGYEARDGRKAYSWKDETEAERKLRDFCIEKSKDTELLVDPAHLKSKSEIEKVIGKSESAKALIQELIEEIPGNKVLKRIKEQRPSPK